MAGRGPQTWKDPFHTLVAQEDIDTPKEHTQCDGRETSGTQYGLVKHLSAERVQEYHTWENGRSGSRGRQPDGELRRAPGGDTGSDRGKDDRQGNKKAPLAEGRKDKSLFGKEIGLSLKEIKTGRDMVETTDKRCHGSPKREWVGSETTLCPKPKRESKIKRPTGLSRGTQGFQSD